MRVVAIIQARMGSTRLPGKVLRDLGGATMLARVVRRTNRATLLDDICVATSVLAADDAIEEECALLAVQCFRGNSDDVLDRYCQAAASCRADAVVRITADCPLIAPELIDELVRAFRAGGADYATNSLVVTYPRGLGVEAFTVAALARAWSQATKSYQRSHVTAYFYENPELFKIVSVESSEDHSRYRWTVDTVEDLEMVRRVYEYFQNCDTFDWRDVLSLMENIPQLAELNAHVQQKALHEG